MHQNCSNRIAHREIIFAICLVFFTFACHLFTSLIFGVTVFMGRFVLHIAKEYLKFSSAHFTIFSDTALEMLHGHNYYVTLNAEFRDSANGITIDFKHLKKIMETLCDVLDEKVLLPSESPYLKIEKEHHTFHVTFHGSGFSKDYRFPCEDVEILPVSNISSEMLSKYLCESFCEKLMQVWHQHKPDQEIGATLLSVQVGVEETRGQAVAYVMDF